MNTIKQLIEVLEALGYRPIHNEEKKDVYFRANGFDSFNDRYKSIVRVILGERLLEFYYGGIDTQHIYYK